MSSKIGLTRWEAEEEDHRKHREKMVRVWERKTAKWEEEKAKGFTCTLEPELCVKKFSDKVLFNEHLREHKKDMQSRMVCTWEKCGQKFKIRREYNNHFKKHSEELLSKTKNNIRSVIMYNKNGLLLEAFEREYGENIGRGVPYKPCGFENVRDLLLAIPDVVEFVQLKEGQELLVAVPDEKTKHIAKMVSNQMETARGYNYRTGEVMRGQDWNTKREIKKVGGRQDRQVPKHVKDQIRELLSLEEYSDGIDLEEVLAAYSNEFGYQMEFYAIGFKSLEDFFGNGLRDTVKLSLTGQGDWLISRLDNRVGFSDHTSGEACVTVHEDMKKNFKRLLRSRPHGMQLEDVPFIYSEFGDLNFSEMGFSDLAEMCAFMPDVCILEENRLKTPLSPISVEDKQPKKISEDPSRLDSRCNPVEKLSEGWYKILGVAAEKISLSRKEDLPKILQLERKISTSKKIPLGSAKELEEGKNVVALHLDGSFHRATVRKVVDAKLVLLFYYDWGWTSMVDVRCVRSIEDDVLTRKTFCSVVSLSKVNGLRGSTTNLQKLFKANRTIYVQESEALEVSKILILNNGKLKSLKDLLGCIEEKS